MGNKWVAAVVLVSFAAAGAGSRADGGSGQGRNAGAPARRSPAPSLGRRLLRTPPPYHAALAP